ncbi:MAG: UvrD-helicase domain-containing protein [Litorimonas sp.]
MNSVLLPTEISGGTITAPAGCGKTHLVAESIAQHGENELPLLVLTHTNAGVAALRNRISRLGANAKKARIATLDGWSLKILRSFPARGEIDPTHTELNNPKEDYPAIRKGVLNILNGGHIRDIVASSYSRLIVDEYQDCQVEQHEMVISLSQDLPTCVLGDPLQSIFNFGGQTTVDWSSDVLATFPSARELTTPWRWNLVGNVELGNWLLSVRKSLISGQKIDLREAPDCVEWVQITGSKSHDWPKQLAAANTKSPVADGGSLIMAKWPSDQIEYAKRIPGAVKIENAELSDLVKFAASFSLTEEDALNKLVNFAATMMTGLELSKLSKRFQSLRANTNRNPPSDAEASLLEFAELPTYRKAAIVLSELNRQTGVRVFRSHLLRSTLKALNAAEAQEDADLVEIATQIRDQIRVSGRGLTKKAVGSTLLFKGLEADVSIILDASTMNARDLYVALTRGARKIVVCSKTPLIP